MKSNQTENSLAKLIEFYFYTGLFLQFLGIILIRSETYASLGIQIVKSVYVYFGLPVTILITPISLLPWFNEQYKELTYLMSLRFKDIAHPNVAFEYGIFVAGIAFLIMPIIKILAEKLAKSS